MLSPNELEALMVKQAITIGTFLLGGAGTALVAYLQTNPMAFTSLPVNHHESTRLEPEVATTVHEGPAAERDDAVTNFALDTLRGAPTSTTPVVAQRELAPCSGWFEIGAATIQEGGATGTHAVRRLCRPEGNR
jgi:hypothetical protein